MAKNHKKKSFENSGKKKPVCTYHAQRFTKMGLPREYWGKVLSPLGQQFSFEKLETPICITPISQIANLKVREAISYLNDSDKIIPNDCYCNALKVCALLNNMGEPVRCVDGYYDTGFGWCKHRFNELKGVYFDATAEAYVDIPLHMIKYTAIRLFTYGEMLGVSSAFGSLYYGTPYRYITGSTLPYNPTYANPTDEISEYFNEYCLNDNGFMQENILERE
ncbi:MAG: hypothetical protein II102_04780 [Bacteroidales bacterium]|nr:hypothetical protein [Bacteroidales bacterium]